ncbi:MAG: hypothetical protein HW387_1575 [Parachlamydiales bacterium]|nr:hypothetical protein [Parachlamydiales bacterium]
MISNNGIIFNPINPQYSQLNYLQMVESSLWVEFLVDGSKHGVDSLAIFGRNPIDI